jgi:uncharacterized protein (TIGR02996 family)
MPRYEVADGRTRTFWEITLAGTTLTVRWGRIGSRGQSRVEQFTSNDDARREYDKLVRQKTRKGYKLVDGIEESVVPVRVEPTARNPELEAAVVADPDDEGALLVLGDWLQQQGDPRGELISLQHALRRAGSDPAAFLERKRAADLFYKQHEPSLLGPLYPLRHLFRLEWQLGYMRGAKLSLHAAAGGNPDLSGLLRQIVDVPAAVALQELAFGHRGEPGTTYQPEIDTLAELERPEALRSLSFAEFWRGTEPEVPATAGALGKLTGVFALRRLVVGCHASFDGLELPELRYFELRHILETAAGGFLRACPKLEQLVISSFESPDLLADLPSVRVLRLGYAGGTIATIADAPVLRQLEALELVHVEPADAEALLAHAASFRHLRTFRVSADLQLDDQRDDHERLFERLRRTTNADVAITRYHPD